MARGRKSGTKAVVKPEPRTVTRTPNQPEQMVFALDIGTRSIIGMVGVVEEDRVKIIAIEQEEHPERAMIDGQIENIEKVAALADKLKKRLEHKIHVKLKRVCVAAAGRALRTQRADFELELPGPQLIDDEIISRLEAGAISRAEEAFEAGNNADSSRRFYLVGYTVCQYYLDQYMISSLKDHRGQQVKVDLIATFLPSEVVESLYTTMNKIDLEVASITLEPIAAINATIPSNLRLLNLVMVDIGAGTSDIAACTGGSVTGYTMATVAGDEITETIMKEYLVDFKTAETIKMNLETEEELSFKDILGFEQTVKKEDLLLCIQETEGNLCKEISSKIIELNGGPPSALFLAGGGSKLTGLKDEITKALQMESNRVAIAGNNFQTNAFSVDYDLNNPEYATPLGIVISSGLNLINDSFRVILNGRPAKLFRSGSFTALNLLMMNGYNFQDIMGRSGQNLIVSVNGRRKVFYGTASQPASLYINKKEGKLSGIIHAGDSIDFIPAVHGVPASACLGDIEGAKDCIEITLNGLYVPLETPLKNGDVIMITLPEPPKPEPEEKEDTDIGFTPETKTESESEDRTIVEHADPVAFKNLKTVTEASALPEVSVSAEVLVPADVSDPTEISDPTEALVPTEVFGGSESSDLTDISLTAAAPFAEPAAMREPVKLLFYLNNAPLYLPQKEDKTPYYLMDMIQYSGIDLKHPKGTVTLAVNGFPGTFTQALKEGDQIRIEEELTLQTPRYNLS